MIELGTRKEYPVNDRKGLFVQCAFKLATFSIGMFGGEKNAQELITPLPIERNPKDIQ